MTDKFYPVSVEKLFKLFIDDAYKLEGFGLTDNLIFDKQDYPMLQTPFLGVNLDTPYGVAAGPHTQLSQNIITAYLHGARYIELKTVQALDELEINKPCIDMQDEGYNCEWSQELKIEASYHEYLNAWLLIHFLEARQKGTKNPAPGLIFNMSVGYDYKGILGEKVQWFLDKMKDCSKEKAEKVDLLSRFYPEIKDINIPDCISNSITLSTMHGCPPDEIEKISRYLIKERRFHTLLKLNPTLIGQDALHKILNDKCGFYTNVPPIAFEHDLKYEKAVEILKKLIEAAAQNNIFFGVKLTNTLECLNNKDIFGPAQEAMYMSGRALHPISINLALKLRDDFSGRLPISFSGGADCFNTPDILRCGLYPVTVCSDLLKPGGYGRLKQYADVLRKTLAEEGISSVEELIKSYPATASDYLKQYAEKVVDDKTYHNDIFLQKNIKTPKKLSYFDCIEAPCTLTCPTHQDIPEYLFHASEGNFSEGFKTILRTNPFPNVLGMVCDHKCQSKCTRVNYDDVLRIRDIKWFVSEYYPLTAPQEMLTQSGLKAAVIGGGPSGLSCAYYLKLAGIDVTVFELKSVSGGMVSEAIPNFRLKREALEKDIERIKSIGVDIHYNAKIDALSFAKIKADYQFIYIAIGAQNIKKLGIKGEEAKGVVDPIQFLTDVKKGQTTVPYSNIAVIGGGNTAIDVARTALRVLKGRGRVTVLYRRSMLEMPADKAEIEALLEEDITIRELTAPLEVMATDNKVSGLKCIQMKLGEKDSSGRSRSLPVEGSEFVLPFDTIIPAVGQDVVLDFLDKETAEELYSNGMAGHVFIGGDAYRGASTIVNAVGDGRKAAQKIVDTLKIQSPSETNSFETGLSFEEMIEKRSLRTYTHLPLVKAGPSDTTAPDIPFSAKEVKDEASRCLFCNHVCSICVTVCPNKANFSFKAKPFSVKLPVLSVSKGHAALTETQTYALKQKYQIINIGDFCNECGNCNTFCPTSGAPYIEKHKFFLTTQSFNEATEGFFISKPPQRTVIVHKKDDTFTTLTKKEKHFIYETAQISVVLDETFSVSSYKVLDDTANLSLSLEKAFEMYVLMAGVEALYEN